MTKHLKIFSAMAIVLLMTGAVQSRDLVVDLSDSIVKITTRFAGTELLLFGAKQGEGDIIVVVRGPWENPVVRKKERVLGVWVNRDEVQFQDVPSYYWVASNKPVEELLPPELLEIHQIGIPELDFVPASENADPTRVIAYSEALKREKIRKDLYHNASSSLLFVDDVLFRTNVKFPANVSVGEFGIQTYLVKDQEIVTSKTTLLNVRKFGLEASIYNFAHRHSFLYGVFAVIIACVAGWAANAAFKRR
jgi:uncharacterized protein (TIGR02186 family)